MICGDRIYNGEVQYREKYKKAKNNYTCGASDFNYGQLGNLGKSVDRNKPFNSNI